MYYKRNYYQRENRVDENGNKLYPFSLEKNAHNIEFRYNRIKNILDDMYIGEIKATEQEIEKLEAEQEKVFEVYNMMFGAPSSIIWLTGKQYSIAKECVIWATETRAETQIQKNVWQ